MGHPPQAIPNARLVTLKDCGHFTFLEGPIDVRKHVDAFFQEK
jgi:pimeloyl-ACP methyl ester carboxylesterase